MRSAVDLLNGIKVVLAVVVVCTFGGAAFGQYCSASGDDDYYEHISGVEVWTISNMTGRSSYTDYTHLSTELHIGPGYLITVTNGDPYSGDQCGVWVDWNADEDFNDVDETIAMSGGPGTFTGTIAPPDTAALGATRMRVRITDTETLSPCGTTDYGEVEDYTIVVLEETVYEIWTAEDMQAIGADANYWDKHFRLMADIDLSGYTGTSFNIIGTSSTKFTGVFNGNGHTISNFTYDSNGTSNIGLFAYVDGASAEIKNLGLINPNVDAGTGSSVGSLVGFIQEGSITNCYAEGGSISGNQRVGGLVGYNNGEIGECYSASDVIGNKFVGGFTGCNGGSISGSHSTGSVSSGGGYVGGLAGYSIGEIGDCYSASDVIGNTFTGGLVGNNGGDMGIGSIANSYSTGAVTGGWGVGGLLGYNCQGSILNCCSTGSVSGNGHVGGLVGDNYMGSISRSYSASSVTGGDHVGGLAGYGSSSYVTDSFWDVNSSGIDTSAGGTGLPTVEMQTESTYTDAGWDFVGETVNGPNDIWKMNCEGMSYPKLSWWQPVPGDFGCPDGVDGIDLGVLCEEWLLEELSADVWPDGFVDFLDWAIFADDWGVTYGMSDLEEFAEQWLKTGQSYLITDIAPESEGDGIVNMADFAALADNWLEGL